MDDSGPTGCPCVLQEAEEEHQGLVLKDAEEEEKDREREMREVGGRQPASYGQTCHASLQLCVACMLCMPCMLCCATGQPVSV